MTDTWDNARLTEEVQKLKQELASLKKQPLKAERKAQEEMGG